MATLLFAHDACLDCLPHILLPGSLLGWCWWRDPHVVQSICLACWLLACWLPNYQHMPGSIPMAWACIVCLGCEGCLCIVVCLGCDRCLCLGLRCLCLGDLRESLGHRDCLAC